MRTDKNGKLLKIGDVINIHQTVNGENLFVILEIDNLDIRYAHDLTYKYQYDKESLLSNNMLGETEYEIIGNIYEYIIDLSIKKEE